MELVLLAVGFVVVFVALCVVFLLVLNARNKRYALCNECKEKYDYQKDIAWNVIEEQVIDGDRPKKVASVEFKAICPKCGYERSFIRKYTVAVYEPQVGKWKSYDLDKTIKNSFIYYTSWKSFFKDLKKDLKDM